MGYVLCSKKLVINNLEPTKRLLPVATRVVVTVSPVYFSLRKTQKTTAEDPFVNRVKVVLKKCSSLKLDSIAEAQLLPTVTYLLDLG